jgi:hypothetical protein
MSLPRRLATSSLVALLLALLCSGPAAAQRQGEYLTKDEMDLVQDIRMIENRTQVFLKVADRRLVALQGGEAKDPRFGNQFGPLPTGSQADLLDDYRQAVEELEIKLDDEFEREKMSDGVVKALVYSDVEIDRQLKLLESLRPKLTEGDAAHYAERAVSAAKEFQDGVKKALDQVPAEKREAIKKKLKLKS